jgi:2-succinyl-5-enolpyruvyl-6-hydroxy-3-cyclohexene-1-carboxylate synthase
VDVVAGHVRDRPRGVIVCGRQTDPSLAEPVGALALAAGYPVLAEPTSQLRTGPHDRSLLITAYEPIARAEPPALAPEWILRFGEMPTSKSLRGWIASLDGAQQLVIDPGYGWNEPTRQADVVLRVDPAALASAVTSALSLSRDHEFADAWLAAERAARGAIADVLESSPEPTEPSVHAALGRVYADGDLVYAASSMPIRDQEAFLEQSGTGALFLANRGANGIDGLISSGAGAAAATGRPTWIVTGDLGLWHDMNGLAALRGIEAAVRIVVMNNDGGGIFEFLPQAEQVGREEFEALFGTPLGLEGERVAALYDLPYERITTPGDVERLAAGGTVLAEVRTDRRANLELHRRIGEAAVAAVERALG